MQYVHQFMLTFYFKAHPLAAGQSPYSLLLETFPRESMPCHPYHNHALPLYLEIPPYEPSHLLHFHPASLHCFSTQLSLSYPSKLRFRITISNKTFVTYPTSLSLIKYIFCIQYKHIFCAQYLMQNSAITSISPIPSISPILVSFPLRVKVYSQEKQQP